MQETCNQPLGREDPLEEHMATLPSKFLPGKSHGQKSLAGYSPRVHKRVRYDMFTVQFQKTTFVDVTT